jgi:hypothetical protein
LSYLRFTPSEYEAVVRVRRRLDFRGFDARTVRLILSLSLMDESLALAERIRTLNDDQIRLVRDHLRGEKPQSFTEAEWRVIAEACGAAPACVRFAGPLQRVLVGRLRKASPRLARRLGRMSISQFVRVFEQAQRLGR